MKLVNCAICILVAAAFIPAAMSLSASDSFCGQSDFAPRESLSRSTAALDEDVDTILSRCCGVALLEVKEIEKVDSRPACGSLDLNIKFEVVNSYGTFVDQISIFLEGAGNSPPGVEVVQPQPVIDPNEVKAGKRYWIAFNWNSHWAIPVKAWEEGTDAVPEKANALADDGHFNWNRTYHQAENVCLEFRSLNADEAENNSDGAWVMRVKRDDELLWEKRYEFPMSEFHGAPQFQSLNFDTESSAGQLVHGQTAVSLDESNEWNVEPGRYLLKEAFEIESGKRRESEVLIYQGPHAPIVQRSYDRPGRTLFEVRYESKNGTLFKLESRTGSGGGMASRRRFQMRTSQWEAIELEESDR